MGMCRTEMVGGGEAYMMNGFDDDDSIMFEEDVFGKIEDLLDFSTVDMQLLLEPEQMMTTYDDATRLGNPDRFDDFPPVPNSIIARDGGSGGSGEVKEDDSTFKCGDIDAAELEWVANFEEESLSPATIDVLPKSNDVVISNGIDGISSEGNNGDILHYRTPSPVSVLEHNGRLIIRGGMSGHGGGSFSSSSSSSPTSSSSCSSISNGIKALAPASPAETVVTRGRAPRTKRPRPPSIPRSNVLLHVASSSYDELLMIPSANYDSEHFAESNPIITSEFQEDQAAAFVDDDHNQNKKKKIKIMTSASTIKIIRSDDENQPASVRKCMHCEITKTPQWRAGPMGPKTLCNACGVRYKSGRLFPEYRPAASPTFVASQHSNSHKKVVEMRVKSTQKVSVPITPSLPVSAKGCELLNYIKSN